MNQLTNFYRNKAEDLQRQVNLLEQKINNIINEGVVQDFKTQFTTFPLTKAVGSAIAHPVDTAKAGADLVSKGVKFAAQNPGSAIKTVVGGGSVIGLPLVGGYLAGTNVEHGVNELLKDYGMDVGKEGTVSSGLNAVGQGLVSYATGDDTKIPEVEPPNAREMIASGAGWGTMGAVTRGGINLLTKTPLMQGVLPAVATDVVAGAAVPLAAYAGYKTGEAIGNKLYGPETITGKDVKKKAEEMGVDLSAPKEYPELKDIQAKTQKEREEREERARQQEAAKRKPSSWEQMAGAKYSG